MLKIGVFGTGHLGKIHIQQWKTLPGVEIIGFYEPDDNQAIAVEKDFQLKRYYDPNQLIKDADAIDIVSTTNTHYEIAKSCIQQSRHIFIEKPITDSVEHARELVKLVNEAQIKCQIGHVERYNPSLLALRGRKIQPMFIEAHRLAEFNPRGTDVSVILDLMIHDLDIILHLIQSPVKKVSANGVAVVSDSVDIANARLIFENGCVANVTASRISLKKMRKMRLFQKDAYIGIDFLNKKTEIVRLKSDMEAKGMFDFTMDLGKGQEKNISIEIPEIEQTNAIQQELADFTLSILQDKPVHVSALDGLNAIEAAHQIVEKVHQQLFSEKI